MNRDEKVQLHECAIVAYRVVDLGIEFCLVTPSAENRWEFPKAALDSSSASHQAALRDILDRTGVNGTLVEDEPLGHFAASRGNESRQMTAYLMCITQCDEAWPQQTTHRRLWCLAEEARVRIRRKPLRRFIDLALHYLEARPHTLVRATIPATHAKRA